MKKMRWVSLSVACLLGIIAISSEEASAKNQTLYRLYNQENGAHFFTLSNDERQQLVTNGWKDEGIAWEVPAKGVPVYRLYQEATQLHHYTKELSEYQALQKSGWQGEGEAFKTLTKKQADQKENIVTVRRAYDPEKLTHNYTLSDAEQKILVHDGWQDEGVAFYGYQPEKAIVQVKIRYAAGSKELAKTSHKKLETGQAYVAKAKEFEGYRLISENNEVTFDSVTKNEEVIFEYSELANEKSLTKLKDKIAKATRLVESEYSVPSWERVKKALKSSYDVAYGDDALQKAVVEQQTQLEKAVKRLVKVEDLTATLQSVEQVKEENFNPKGWKQFAPALQQAKTALADPNIKQKQVDQANQKLLAGIEELVYVKDLKELSASLQTKNKAEFTHSSWRVLADAQKMGKQVLEDKEAEQAAVNSTFKNLQKAERELQVKGDTKPLETLVYETKDKKAVQYTKKSWKKVAKALKSAQPLLVDPDVLPEQVVKQQTKLQKSVDRLEKKGETKELQKVYQEVERYEAKDFLPDHWSEFETSRKETQELLATKKEITQTVVDQRYQALITSKQSLVKISDQEKLNSLVANADSLDATDFTANTWQAFEAAVKAAADQTDPQQTLSTLHTVQKDYQQLVYIGRLKQMVEKEADYTKKDFVTTDETDHYHSYQHSLKQAGAILAKAQSNPIEQKEVDQVVKQFDQSLKGKVKTKRPNYAKIMKPELKKLQQEG